ncbi:MAG TPA: glutamate racemase [Chlamydiales bacterium]|nr:glutamate racemase [Chlamydiales bacterium]
MTELPIGLFDSGFGGLTVMREVVRILPHENLIYLGDTAHLPYGTKSPEAVLGFALENSDFLLKKNIKLLIVACHTACSHALAALQKKLPIPVIGVIEPGFELLMQTTRTMRVAILGTTSTIESGIYQSLFQKHMPQAEIHPIACPLFVPLIEEGFVNHISSEWIARTYLSPLTQKGIDAALLACTHYPLIRPILQKVLGPTVQLIEPAEQCAWQAFHALDKAHLLNPQRAKPRYEFFATDDPEKFRRLGRAFFGSEIEIVKK